MIQVVSCKLPLGCKLTRTLEINKIIHKPDERLINASQMNSSININCEWIFTSGNTKVRFYFNCN